MSMFSLQDEMRAAVDSATIKEWTRQNTARSIRDLLIDWLVIMAAFGMLSAWQTLPMFVLVFFVVGTRQYALFILGHDAIHGSLSPSHTTNDRLARWCIYGPMFMGLEDGRRNHLDHHKLMGSTADPDRYLHVLSNKSTLPKFLLFLSGLATFGKTVLKVTPWGKIKAAHKQSDSEPRSILSYCMDFARERIPVFVTQVLIISYLYFLQLPWWTYFVMWMAPIYFCVFLPDEIRAFSEHVVLSLDDDAVDEQRLITFVPSWIERTVFSPHNMNYHAEHHLWPRIPYHTLPTAHNVMRSEPRITVRHSYINFLISVGRFLRAGGGVEMAKPKA